MVDRSELQNKARLVESHRQHLEELQRRMEQITGVINEHQITEEILSRLTDMSNSGNAKAHVSIGAGVTLNYQHSGAEQGTAIIDLGAGIFGERKWSDAIKFWRLGVPNSTICMKPYSSRLGPLKKNSAFWLKSSMKQQKSCNLLRPHQKNPPQLMLQMKPTLQSLNRAEEAACLVVNLP